MVREDDRFGTEAAFAAAIRSHGDAPFLRMGMYVPTRGEIATLRGEELFEVLDLWFWEGPTELIPSRAQVRQVREIVNARDDVDSPAMAAVVALLKDYLEEA